MKQRTEEEYYIESKRLREETMRMADALKDNPMRFVVTNVITMDVEITKSDLKTIVSKNTQDNRFNAFKNKVAQDIRGFLEKSVYEGWREVIPSKHPETAFFAYFSRELGCKAYLCVRKIKNTGLFKPYDEMSTMDVKQTIKAFSSIAEKHNMEDWMDIKDYYVSSYASFSENLGEEEALKAISSILLDENNRANVSLFNSVYNYAKQWIQEYKENNADRLLSPEDKFRKEYRDKLINKIGSNANIPLFCHGYDSPIAHELMYIMYQHLRNAELKAEAEKQGLRNKYVQIIVDETEKVTKKYCHVFLQECIEYYNYPDKPVITRHRCPSCGSTNIMDDIDYGLECNECGRTWNAPYGKRLYL